tara:strand:- start:235 stop:573 length:339 start_codon:yes stop_codon:yes gene_type:complete
MKILKQILAYLIWIGIALLMGVCHMLILLGPKGPSTGFFRVLNDILYYLGMILGLKIGGIIALLFISIDIFYLKKKLKNNIKSTIIRFFTLLIIAVVVGITHYVLEKVIDVI